MKRALPVILLAALVLAAGATSSSAKIKTAAIQGVTETVLPVNPLYEPYMAVDPVGHHVFVAASEQTSSIYVLDFDGNLVKTITGEQGASGMAVDTATHTLYVADYDATAVAEIDTQTLTETARFSTSPFVGVFSLAVAGGKLWMATAANSAGTVAVSGLDGSNITSAGIGDGVPELLASSANGNLLALGDHETEPSGIFVYDVSGNSPASVSNSGGNGCEFVNDVAFDASAANVLTACGYPYYVSSLSTNTGLSSSTYPTGPYPDAVAASADGKYVAASNSSSVFVYPVGDTTPANSWAIGAFAHSLAFSPDGSRLFALARASNNDLALETIDDPTLVATTTSLTGPPDVVRYGDKAKLSAHVTGTTTGTVELLASSDGATPAPIAFTPIDSNGDATFTVEPMKKTDYSVKLEQGATYGESSSSIVMVDVAPRLSVTARPLKSKHGAVLTGVITPARPKEPLVFSIARRQHGTWVPLPNRNAQIRSNGKARLPFHAARKGAYRVEVAYNGDSDYSGSASTWTKFTVR